MVKYGVMGKDGPVENTQLVPSWYWVVLVTPVNVIDELVRPYETTALLYLGLLLLGLNVSGVKKQPLGHVPSKSLRNTYQYDIWRIDGRVADIHARGLMVDAVPDA